MQSKQPSLSRQASELSEKHLLEYIIKIMDKYCYACGSLARLWVSNPGLALRALFVPGTFCSTLNGLLQIGSCRYLM